MSELARVEIDRDADEDDESYNRRVALLRDLFGHDD